MYVCPTYGHGMLAENIHAVLTIIIRLALDATVSQQLQTSPFGTAVVVSGGTKAVVAVEAGLSK